MIKIYDGRNEFYQWDLDRKIVLSDLTVTEVHFCNKTSDCSLVVEVREVDGLHLADVPNILLQTDWPINVYAYCGDCYTKEHTTFKVNRRSRPDDYVYTETEVKRWEALEQRVNETLDSVAAAEAERNNAETERAAAEETRVDAELGRNAAEATRKNEFNTMMGELANDALQLDGHERRITQLERHISNDYFVTDDSVAYTKIAPVDACPYAEIDAIGGMTYKCKNLFDLANAELAFSSGNSSNASYEVIDEEKLKISITKNNSTAFYRAVEVYLDIDLSQTSKLYASAIANPYNLTTSTIILGVHEKSTRVKATSKSSAGTGKQSISVLLDVPAEYRNENYIAKILFYGCVGEIAENGGYIEYSDIMVATEETPYEPYFEGLRSAKVTSLKSEGANLIPYPYIDGSSLTHNGVTFTVNADGNIKAVGTAPSDKDSRYELCRELPISSGNTYTISGEGLNNQAYLVLQRYINGAWDKNLASVANTPITITPEYVEGATYRLGLYIKRGETIDLTVRAMLNAGTTAAPFTPYIGTLDTLAIPEAVQSLPDYGEGKSATEYNYIDFGRKVFKHDYAKIRLLSTVGSYNATSNWYYIAYQSLGISPITRSVLCNLLPSVNIEGDSSLYGIYTNYSQTHIIMRIKGLTTASEYKQWLTDNEVYIIERLAEPIETDISAYLSDENFIEIEGGGAITFINEHNQSAPSAITYLLKEGSI